MLILAVVIEEIVFDFVEVIEIVEGIRDLQDIRVVVLHDQTVVFTCKTNKQIKNCLKMPRFTVKNPCIFTLFFYFCCYMYLTDLILTTYPWLKFLSLKNSVNCILSESTRVSLTSSNSSDRSIFSIFSSKSKSFLETMLSFGSSCNPNQFMPLTQPK